MARRKLRSQDVQERKPDNSVKIAIISTAGIILTTLITALFAPAILKSLENTPSPMPSANPTLSSTSTSIPPTVTGTPVTPAVSASPDDVFEEVFTEGTEGLLFFSPHEVDNDKMDSSASVIDSAFRWQITDKIGTVDQLSSGLPILSDFELEATLSLVYESNPPRAFGVSFRSTKSGFYRFQISNSGYFMLGKYIAQEDEHIDIITWTYSDAIKLNEPNGLRVRAQAGSLRLYINDVLVANPVDDTFRTGQTSIVVSLRKDETIILDVKSFKVTVLTP
jgi:hypothetical protein